MGESREIADSVPSQLKYGLLSLLLVGCAGDDRDDVDDVGLDVGTETGEVDDGDDDSAERFDIGSGHPVEPCSKVDLLFVIDDSGSMQDEQDALIAAFPGFVQDIEQSLISVDSYHVGVVTTDPYVHNAPLCRGLGHLVTETGGEGSSGQQCNPFSSSKRYLDESEPDLAEKFACAAQVGTRGMPGEAQIGAVLQAVSPLNHAFKGCNEGFIREDALLVVVLISDEDDAESCYPTGCVGGTPGSIKSWFHQLVKLKGGREENVVMLSIVGGPGAYWECGVEEAPKIVEFTERFTYGSVGDVCHMDYAQYFGDAMSMVSEGCTGFSPVG
jgi:hypothetical protein